MELWYTEKHSEDVGITMKVTRTLFSGTSEYQQLEIVETPEYGRMMLLDGLVMVTERDEFVYHDMIAHPALSDPHFHQVSGDGTCCILRFCPLSCIFNVRFLFSPS